MKAMMNVAKGPVFSRDLYTGRIVGGEPVDYPRQLHFLVSLQTRRGEHFCGGSLISPTTGWGGMKHDPYGKNSRTMP